MAKRAYIPPLIRPLMIISIVEASIKNPGPKDQALVSPQKGDGLCCSVSQLVSFIVDRLRLFADTPGTNTDSSCATVYPEPNIINIFEKNGRVYYL